MMQTGRTVLFCYLSKGHLMLLLLFFFTSSATKIETCWRGVQARKERDRRAWAVKVIKK